MNPSQEDSQKQIQLMMNLSLLSSLNQKVQNIQPYTNIIPLFPQIIPQQQIINQINPNKDQNLITQLSYNSMINEPHNTIFSYNNINENNNNPIKTSDTYYCSPGFYITQKPFTTMNYYVNPLVNNNLNVNQFELLGKKIARNKIIINNEKKFNNDDSGIYNKNLINNMRILNEDLDEYNNNEINNNKKNYKHHSAPLFKTNDNNIMFETHLLKTHNDRESEKIYKCKHPNCDLCYRTKKQLVSHHGKMDIECQRDTICLLKLIANAKKCIIKLYKNNQLSNQKVKLIKQKYESLIKNVSISDYAQMICGYKFNDIIITSSEIQEFNFDDIQKKIEELNFNNI